jgi:hypothetical protein
MAITTTTITKAAGWARTDLIYQLEEAFAWLGWHGSTRTGIAHTITSYSGGGSVGIVNTDYEDVFTSTSSGIGTGASFYVDRQSGSISRIHINRPGYGYTTGELVTLSSEDIGTAVAGASNITVSIATTTTSYGSTTTFYDKDVTAGAAYPWGVVRHTIQANKKFGDTYRGFQVDSDTQITVVHGSGFHPGESTWTQGNGIGYPNRFCGETNFDLPEYNITNSSIYFDRSTNRFGLSNRYQAQFTIASSNSYALDLNIFRSGIDPKFAVISYKQPTLSSTKLRDNTYATFILHNFTSTLWDYDSVFLGGVTEIYPSGGDSNPYLGFRSELSGAQLIGQYYQTKRMAEYGYITYDTSLQTEPYKEVKYYSPAGDNSSGYLEPTLYYRDSDRGGSYNAVIKGIPLNLNLIPVPYYIPDDFVLIQFELISPSANIQQGDTITISGSEVYTVIQGSYRQDTRTRGILFCARTT